MGGHGAEGPIPAVQVCENTETPSKRKLKTPCPHVSRVGPFVCGFEASHGYFAIRKDECNRKGIE